MIEDAAIPEEAPTMTPEQAIKIAQEIWDVIPADTAHVWLVNEDRVSDEKLGHSFRLEGNLNGLLRLSAELLSAAGAGGSACDYLFHSSPIITAIVKTTTTEPPKFDLYAPQLSPWKQTLVKFGCLAIFIAAAVCTLVGFVVLLRAIS
jgi:hypothetical protein